VKGLESEERWGNCSFWELAKSNESFVQKRKTEIRWLEEGEETFKFFHSYLNQKESHIIFKLRRLLRIKSTRNQSVSVV